MMAIIVASTKQYVRDQQKHRRHKQLGWTVIEVFADDLWNTARQRAFAQKFSPRCKYRFLAVSTFMPGIVGGSLTINAHKGNTGGENKQKYNKASQH